MTFFAYFAYPHFRGLGQIYGKMTTLVEIHCLIHSFIQHHKANPLNSSTILITGAKGFTGLYLQEAARKSGLKVVNLTSNLNDQESLEREVLSAKPDYVAHLAGISFVASKDHEAFYRVHALGTSNLLQALTKLEKAPKRTSIKNIQNAQQINNGTIGIKLVI